MKTLLTICLFLVSALVIKSQEPRVEMLLPESWENAKSAEIVTLGKNGKIIVLEKLTSPVRSPKYKNGDVKNGLWLKLQSNSEAKLYQILNGYVVFNLTTSAKEDVTLGYSLSAVRSFFSLEKRRQKTPKFMRVEDEKKDK